MEKKIIVHGAHHKVGTHLMNKILQDVCKVSKLNFYKGTQVEVTSKTDVWLETHSKIDFKKLSLKRNYVGSHMIRDPRSIIISGYFFHKTVCVEDWVLKPNFIENKNYKEHLNLLSLEDGISFEMNNCGRWNIMDMYNWNYNNGKILNIKYEDLLKNYDKTVRKILKHYGTINIEACMKVVSNHDFNKLGDMKRKIKHITNKEGDIELWKKYFTEKNIEEFKKIFPLDVFEKLGYEKFVK